MCVSVRRSFVSISPEEFAKVWNNQESYETIKDVAAQLGISAKYTKKRASVLRRKHDQSPNSYPKILSRKKNQKQDLITEDFSEFRPEMGPDDCIKELKGLYFQDPSKNITNIYFRTQTGISDSTWTRYFGTFLEFRRQAGLDLNRNQHSIARTIAKHNSVDHYREFNKRVDYGDKYDRGSNKKHKIVIGVSDLHDIEVDPFYLRVFIEACKIVNPDIINLGGDIFDLAEFGKYGVDPREWDVVGRIKFVHEHILKPIREACPDAQIDFVEGNHEFRLLRHLADATPALKAVLSDLLGLTIPKLLGLDKYEVNYIAKADLGTFNKGDQKKEVGKSYAVYDNALLVHHHPHAKEWGLPGWNGHHHVWKVFNLKNAEIGSYQWMQLGCGHMLSASYCEGEFWNNGFNIAHINTETKTVNHEYIPITDMAIVGGVIFYRNNNEMVGLYSGRLKSNQN